MISKTAMLALGMICAVPLNAASANPNQGVSLILQSAGSRAYRVEGRFQMEASRQAVWDILTDYDHMAQFIPSLLRSKVIERRAHGVRLQQEAFGRVWMFSRKVHVSLDVTEDPMTRISFKDVSHQDFEYYRGSWEIADAGKDREVIYRLEAKRNFAAPNFLAASALKKDAKDLLADVRSEILRRKGKGS